MKLAKKLNKIGVVVNSGFGFVGNRIFLPYLREAQLMLIQGTPAEKIDQVAYDWGFAMGPLEAMDLSGLDVFHSIYQQLADEPGKYAYYPVSEYLYNNSRLGKKNDSGFYHYQDDHKSPDPEVMILAKQVADDYEIKPRELTDEDIINRLVMAMVSEASYILQEKIASRPSDIDVIMVNGYGFPRYRGGGRCAMLIQLVLIRYISRLLIITANTRKGYGHRPACLKIWRNQAKHFTTTNCRT
jgi:3-hydroxyacyl-CoA dehydrogenase